MPGYTPRFTDADFERLKGDLVNLGNSGTFDVLDALTAVANAGVVLNPSVVINAGDVAAILGDLVDLGILKEEPRSPADDLPRYSLA